LDQTQPKTVEGEKDMYHSAPVLPVTVDAHGHGHGDHHGDEVLSAHVGLQGRHNSSDHLTLAAFGGTDRLFLNESISRNSKENACITHSANLSLERGQRRLEAQAERIERENQRFVKEEHQRTRDMIAAQEKAALQAQIAAMERERVDGKFAALQKLTEDLAKA